MALPKPLERILAGHDDLAQLLSMVRLYEKGECAACGMGPFLIEKTGRPVPHLKCLVQVLGEEEDTSRFDLLSDETKRIETAILENSLGPDDIAHLNRLTRHLLIALYACMRNFMLGPSSMLSLDTDLADGSVSLEDVAAQVAKLRERDRLN